MCRYCFEGEEENNYLLNKLIFPCDCNTPVHKNCIKKWIETSENNNCEICKKEYNGIIIIKSKKCKHYIDICLTFSLLYFCFCVFFCNALFDNYCSELIIQVVYGSFLSIVLFYVIIYKIYEYYKIRNYDLMIRLYL